MLIHFSVHSAQVRNSLIVVVPFPRIDDFVGKLSGQIEARMCVEFGPSQLGIVTFIVESPKASVFRRSDDIIEDFLLAIREIQALPCIQSR